MGFSPRSVRRLVAAWLAAAAMLFAAAGTLIGGHDAFDRECAPALAETHDHAAHRITSAADEPADHCAACHLTRTVRGAAPAHQAVLRARPSVAAPPIDDTRVARVQLRADDTRGPPSA